MSVSELDATYRSRIEDIGNYTLEVSPVLWENLDTRMGRHNIEVAKSIGYGLLLFGGFKVAGDIVCQPWIADPSRYADRDMTGWHGVAAKELIYIHNQEDLLAYEGPGTEGPITSRALTTFIWRQPDERTGVLVRDQYNHLEFSTFGDMEEELEAIRNETSAHNAMHDHVVYVQDPSARNAALRIAAGEVVSVPLH